MKWNRHPLRTGFTLLELLLAMGMTTLLMAAVYGAMSTYWNLALDSREEITRSQIARRIMQDLSRDIRSVTFVEQIVQSSDDSSGTSGTESPSGVTTSVYRNGLIGFERELMLYISRPDKHLDYVALPDTLTASSRNSDLMIVRWLLADSSGSGLASAIAGTNETGSGSVAGLARGEGGVNGFGRAIEMDDIGQQLEVTSLYAPEVQDIVFEYFDGVDWLPEWNSTDLNLMPQAIRIELILRHPPSDDDGRINPRDLPATSHQLVVPIPVARPFVQEMAL